MENIHADVVGLAQPRNAKALSLSIEEVNQFYEQGYLGPYDLLSTSEAKEIAERCLQFPKSMLPWVKGRHAMVKEMAEIAMHPGIVNKLVSIMDEDILLWGSIIIQQKASGKHPMHVDVEHTVWDGVSIWLAMQNVVSGKSFSIVPGSHLFNVSPQDLNKIKMQDFNDDEVVLAAARKIKPDSEIVHLNVKDGQFIIFSGKLWHGTKNTTDMPRTSIVLQYTRPENKVKIVKRYSTPADTTWEKKRPPCLLVHGQDQYHVNKLVHFHKISKVNSLLKGLFLYLPSNALKRVKM